MLGRQDVQTLFDDGGGDHANAYLGDAQGG